jgi:thioredoxin-like negative regulator of GroEL
MTAPDNRRDVTAEPGVSTNLFRAAARFRRPLPAFAALALCGLAGFVALRGLSPVEIDASPTGLARSLMDEGEYARAAATLRAAYRAHPGERLRIEAARALLSAGDNYEALELLRDGLPEESLGRDADYLRAEALIRLRRFAEASSLAREIAENDRSGAALLLSARAAYGAGRMDDALEFTGGALRNGGPSLGAAWLFRARLALDANDLAAATAAIARARESGAPAREISAAEIEALIRRGAFEDASAAISRLQARAGRRARQDDPLSEYLSAMLDSAKGDYVSATRRLRAAERWIGGIANGPLLLAMAHDGAGDVAQADRRFAALVGAEPENAVAIFAAGDRLIAAGRLEEAGAIADRSEAPLAAAYLRLAAALAAADHDAASEAAKAFVDAPFPPSPAETVFGPHAAPAQLSRGRYLGARELAEGTRVLLSGDARQAGRTARQLDQPAAAPAMLNLIGELYFAAGDDAQAAAAFGRASSAAPRSSKALIGRTRAAVRAGNLGADETLLRERVAAEPDLIVARTLLARVLMAEGRAAAAVESLAPVEEALAASAREAMVYAAALERAGDGARLAAFAERFRDLHPEDPAAAALLARAGLSEAAAAAARAALLAAPERPERIGAYRSAMRLIGRGEAAEAFLAALAQSSRAARAAPASPGEGEDLAALRRAYLARPTDAAAISRFGTALAAAGGLAESARVMREACFWASFESCAVGAPPPS